MMNSGVLSGIVSVGLASTVVSISSPSVGTVVNFDALDDAIV